MYSKIQALLASNRQGFTANLDCQLVEPDKGYIVAITNNRVNGNVNTLFLQYKSTASILSYPADRLFIGGWFDGTDYYLDLSILVNTFQEANTLALLFNQKAIWDCEAKECI